MALFNWKYLPSTLMPFVLGMGGVVHHPLVLLTFLPLILPDARPFSTLTVGNICSPFHLFKDFHTSLYPRPFLR